MKNITLKQSFKIKICIFFRIAFAFCFMIFTGVNIAGTQPWIVGSGENSWNENITMETVIENAAQNISLGIETVSINPNNPTFSTIVQSSETSLNDGLRKWVFREDSDFWNPREFYHNNVGGGTIDLISENPYAGNSFWGKGTANVPDGTNQLSLLENSQSRAKIRITNSNGHTLIVTIYPTGKYYANYNIVGTLGPEWGGFGTYYGTRLPELYIGPAWNDVTKTWVLSDISGNEYAGIIWCPFTTSMAMADQFDAICSGVDHVFNRHDSATLSGSGQILIDASNYRATTALRDLLTLDYRNPANTTNGHLSMIYGSCIGDGYDENTGAYVFNANNNQVKFNISGLTYTKYKPTFEIYNYTASVLPVITMDENLLTRGIDYNADFKNDSESTDTIIIQYLNDIITNLEFDIKTEYKLPGRITSISKDVETVNLPNDVWNQISITAIIPVNTEVNIYISTSKDNGVTDPWTSWTLVKDNAESGIVYDFPSANQERYGKFRLDLNTFNSTISPEIESVTMIPLSATWSNNDFLFITISPRIFTPNGDGINDTVNFVFENPTHKNVSGQIFNIAGCLIKDNLYQNSMSSFIWDGKNNNGILGKGGVYIYQIKVENEFFNGTIVLVK